MRIVKEIPNDECKITVFSWNDKYLIKFEKGAFEQTYKVSEWDLLEESDLDNILSADFCNKVISRFSEMGTDFSIACEHL